MTDKEAIEIIKDRNFYCIECIDRSEKCCKALKMAIESLENQKSVIEELENIKAEIQEEILNSKGYVTYSNALMRCYEIVDNHISELKGE